MRPRNLRRRPDFRGRQQSTGNVSHPITFRADRLSRAYQTKSPTLKLQKRLRAVVLCTIAANRLGAAGALLPAGPEATINGIHIGVVLSIWYHNAEREIVTPVARRAAVIRSQRSGKICWSSLSGGHACSCRCYRVMRSNRGRFRWGRRMRI